MVKAKLTSADVGLLGEIAGYLKAIGENQLSEQLVSLIGKLLKEGQVACEGGKTPEDRLDGSRDKEWSPFK